MREIWLSFLVALTVAGSFPAVAQTPNPATAATGSGQAASMLALGSQDRILGKPDAPITIVEYGSFTCPHCAYFAKEVLPKLKQKWIDSGKAKLALRPFPRDDEDLKAAMLVRCAPPDKYYPMADTLFATQDQWVGAKDWQTVLRRTALLAGISKKEFDACLANNAVENQLLQSRLVATNQLGVDATPTFFINGNKFEGEPTVQGLDQALAGAARKS